MGSINDERVGGAANGRTPNSHDTARRPLAGLRVIDLTQVVSGAVTTMLMADFGAEVIKVEPIAGEPYRSSGYAIDSEAGETNLNILRYTRGKKSVALDLKSPEGREILRALLADADVLVENFRPGVLARLGFDRAAIEALNPRIVYTTVSGFGHDDLYESPFRDRPAYAIITEAMSGLTHLAGDGEGPPIWMGFAMADIFAGTLAFSGTLLSLLDRDNGSRRRVDVAMYDAGLLMNDLAIAAQSIAGETLGPGQYLLQSPWGPFQASDGYVVIAVLTESQWRRLADAIGRPELGADARLSSGRKRSQHHDTLVAPAVEAWCRERTKEQVTELLTACGVPAAPVNTAQEVIDSPATAAREMLVEADNVVTGPIAVVGNPIKLGGEAGEAGGAARHIPALGEDTVQVLADVLGHDAQRIEALLRAGVVAAPAAQTGGGNNAARSTTRAAPAAAGR
ncbi:MAG TPA: CoA transferase [Conexibacter sp.]|jgi:crotonobetainyl-CoA:carnitine CoA-transferase CaiB-like acyl-CoA transferase